MCVCVCPKSGWRRAWTKNNGDEAGNELTSQKSERHQDLPEPEANQDQDPVEPEENKDQEDINQHGLWTKEGQKGNAVSGVDISVR